MDSEGTRAPTHPPTHTHTHTHTGGGWWEQGGVQGWKSAANIMAMCVCVCVCGVCGGGLRRRQRLRRTPPASENTNHPPRHPLFPFTVTRLTYSLEFSRSSSDSLQSSSD